MRRTIAALAARKYSGPYRANLKPPAMPGVMTFCLIDIYLPHGLPSES